MAFLRPLCTVIPFLCLTSCLKVTGEAKDPFDIAHGEQPFGFSQLSVFNKHSKKAVQETPAALVELNDNLESTDELVPVPDTASSVAGQQIDPDFEKWKSERSNRSEEYEQFREYLEYKEWLEYQKAQEN